MTFNITTYEAQLKNRHIAKELMSDLSQDFFSLSIEQKYPESIGTFTSAQKLRLSKEFLKNPQVQRILSDMAGRLELFLNQQMKENSAQIESFLREPQLPFPKKQTSNVNDKSPKRILNHRPETSQCFLTETKTGQVNQMESPSTESKQNRCNRAPSSPSGRVSPTKKLRAQTNVKTRVHASPQLSPNKEAGNNNEEKPRGFEPFAPVIYRFTELGKSFTQAIGKTEQIRENLSSLIAEMDDHVTLEFKKLNANQKDVEDLFATKERIVNILEEIIEKEYTTPQEMASMITENWEITEEYEKNISDIVRECNKEKELIKQRYENRIYNLKENFTFELIRLDEEIQRLKDLLQIKEDDYTTHLRDKNNEIDALMEKLATLDSSIDKEDQKTNTAKLNKKSKNSIVGSQLELRKGSIRPKGKASEASFGTKSRVAGTKTKKKSQGGSNNENQSAEQSNKALEEVTVTPKHESLLMPENLLEVGSIYDDRRGSRTSVSSRGVSIQQFILPSARIDDWEGDDKRKIKKLRDFFVRIYEKILVKKGAGSLDSFECTSDDEGSEDWNMDIGDYILRQIADTELCEAAGVKPIDFDQAFPKERRGSFIKKKFPLLFQRKKKTNLNIVEVILEAKDENKEDKIYAVFEKDKESIINLIEAITDQTLTPEIKELPIPQLLFQEFSIHLDKMLTLADFQEHQTISENYDVTVEQLILNVMNFYVSVLSEKHNILRRYFIGKKLEQKVFKDAEINTELPVEEKREESSPKLQIVTSEKETQTGPNLFIDLKSTNTTTPISIPKSNQSPLKTLQESLDSWKKKLSNQGDLAFLRLPEISNANLSEEIKNLLLTHKGGAAMGITNKMMVNKLRRRLHLNTTFNVPEKEKESSRNSPVACANRNQFFYSTNNSATNANLPQERAFWRNVLVDDLFPQNIPMTSGRLLEGESPHAGSHLSKKYGYSLPITYLQAPEKEKTVPKREEIRQKIMQEKMRFTSYKEEEERSKIEALERSKQRLFDEVNLLKREEKFYSRTASMHQDDIHDLCKKTVLALYEYIDNVQKDGVNSAKLKGDLNDVNRKVSEIEEMLQARLNDRRYAALAHHMHHNPANTTYYSNGVRSQPKKSVDGRMNATADSWTSNSMNIGHKPILLGMKKSRDSQSRARNARSSEKKDRKLEDDNILGDHAIEGFSGDITPTQNLSVENLDLREASMRSTQIKFGEKQALKHVTESDGADSLNNTDKNSNENNTNGLIAVKDENHAQNKEFKPKVEALSREEILKKISLANESIKATLPPKGKATKDNKEQDYRFLKKTAFRVKRVTVTKEKVPSDLNNSVL